VNLHLRDDFDLMPATRERRTHNESGAMLLVTEELAHADMGVASLYEAYQRPILIYLRRIVSDYEVAEDLCQETFIKALRHWDNRDPEASVSAWLYRIATNTAYDFLRRRRRIRFTTLCDTEYAHCVAESPELHIDDREPVQQALAQLPPIYRLPLLLHSCSGHSTQEIARALGCSNSAVKTRLFRARARFREVYQADMV
jgi:RNA polymerase sigma-70 factor (ECF subfamily)